MVKNLPAMQETQVWSLVWEDLLEKGMATHSSILAMAPHSSTPAWKIPWTKEPGRLQSMGSLRVGHDWVTSLSLFTFMHWRRKVKSESLQASRSFPMSWFFISGGQSIRASTSESVLPMNSQGWPLGLTGLVSLQSKGLSRVLSNTTCQFSYSPFPLQRALLS